MTVFYDAADWRNLPAGQLACLYGDGRYAVTAAELRAVDPPQFRMITVEGDGRTCSIIDGKPDNSLSNATVRAFVRERRGLGMTAIIYCPRSWVAEYRRILYDSGHGTLLDYPRLYWWIATLDGKPWTAAELSADIQANYDATLPPERIWAVQNTQIPKVGPGALADQSTLFLPWRP